MAHPLKVLVAADAPHHGHLGPSAQGGGSVVNAVLLGVGTVAVGLALGRLLRQRGRLRRRTSSLLYYASALVVAIVLGTAIVAQSSPARPPAPGVPLLRTLTVRGQPVPILVVPQQPGLNLVSIGAPSASVGADKARLTTATPRPGSTHVWAEVWLPSGRSRLWVRASGGTRALDVDTGSGPASTPAALRGEDGPECASAALGTLAAGGVQTLVTCPADRLTDAEAAALRSMVGFIARRGDRTLALLGDTSPRSTAALTEVRAAAARAGLSVVPPSTPGKRHPLIVVTGWAGAASAVRKVESGGIATEGTYLAPWLLAAPLLQPSAGQLIPLWFTPQDPAPMAYYAALTSRYPGEPPTSVGYDAWQRVRGARSANVTLLYAAAVFYTPGTGGPSGGHHSEQGWLPNGMITQASPPLTG